MRINSHAHGGHAERNDEGKLVPPVRMAWQPGNETPEEYVKTSMEVGGVDRVMLLDPPDVAFGLHEIFGDYVIPVPMIDGDNVTAEDIDDLFKRGAKGIKFISPCKSYGHEDYWPLYGAIHENNGLAVFHTGFVAIAPFLPGGIYARDNIVDIDDMRPSKIDRIARRFPDLRILMAHYGNPWWEECWKITVSHKNVYADLSGGTAKTRSLDMWEMIFAPNGKLDEKGVGKLTFGTDGGAFFPGSNLGREPIFEFYDKLYERLSLSEETREKIDRGNMLMLIDEA